MVRTMHWQRKTLIALGLLLVTLAVLSSHSLNAASPDLSLETPTPPESKEGESAHLYLEGAERASRVPTEVSVNVAGWTDLMTEDFEGTFPRGNWEVSDGNGAEYGEYYWAKRNCRPRSGSYSAWAVGGGADGSALPCDAS